MGMSVKVPGALKRVMPDAHRIVTQDYDLILNLHLRELFPPPEFGGDLPGAGIVVAFHKEDVLAPILFRYARATLRDPRQKLPRKYRISPSATDEFK